jgi:hypothetical protein
MKFKSRKDILFQVIGLGLMVFFIGYVLLRMFANGYENYTFMWNDILMLAVAGFLMWLGLGTNYQLTQSELKYKSGPIRGEIQIHEIHEIIKGKTLWSGLKPATARHGLIIKYKKYHEIYISPQTNDSFVKKILALNSAIKITSE